MMPLENTPIFEHYSRDLLHLFKLFETYGWKHFDRHLGREYHETLPEDLCQATLTSTI